MTEFEIKGRLITKDITHEEMIEILYKLLKSEGIFFHGITEKVDDK